MVSQLAIEGKESEGSVGYFFWDLTVAEEAASLEAVADLREVLCSKAVVDFREVSGSVIALTGESLRRSFLLS